MFRKASKDDNPPANTWENVDKMDFWSRLVGSVGGTSAAKYASVNNPQQRLDRFKKVHHQVLIAYKGFSKKAVCNNLANLSRLLEEEIRSPAPHPCITYVAAAQVYDIVATIAQSFSSEQIVHLALQFFNLLVDNEEGGFVEDDSFADVLIKCLDKISTLGSLQVSAQTEGDIAELLFGIAARIRLQPAILPVWFRLRTEAGDPSRTTFDLSTSSGPDRQIFPLFYFLVEYLHHDGRVGDFARTGLLYLLGSSIHSEELEKWIVESDLPKMMASGLGALYGRLSRKLVLSFAQEPVPVIAAFSEVQGSPPLLDAELTGSPEFQATLGTFLSYLAFWQDILEHCPSEDVRLTLLEHFKLLFLQQLLYPSLLESSDADGGSSVAVLTYLRFILGSIHYPDLVMLIMQYLLALPEPQPDDSKVSRPTTLARRRKSYTLRRDLAMGEEKPSPDIYTLVDLVLTSLRSHNEQTITATLRLCSTVLSKQHPYAISTLVKVIKPEAMDYHRNFRTHSLHLDKMLSMAESLAANDGLEDSYQTYLLDVQNLLEMHSCSSHLLTLPGTKINMSCEAKIRHALAGSKPIEYHLIAMDDPLLLHLLNILKNFLVNDIEVNLSLTQLLTVLASCGYTSMEGWLLGDIDEKYLPSDNDARMATKNDKIEDQSPRIVNEDQAKDFKPSNSLSPIFATFDSLIEQVDSFRKKIQDFDIFLAEQRHIFKVNDEMESTLADMSALSWRSEDSNGASPKIWQKPNHLVSLSQKFLSETTSSNASRASSPRGRQQNDSSSNPLAKKLGHLRISPSPSPSKSTPSRTFSASPLRKRDLSPPKRFVITPTGPPDALRQKIKLGTTSHHPGKKFPIYNSTGSAASSVRSGSVDLAAGAGVGTGDSEEQEKETKEVTLGHLLTNIIILQEFMLELAALIEVRASLFGELR